MAVIYKDLQDGRKMFLTDAHNVTFTKFGALKLRSKELAQDLIDELAARNLSHGWKITEA